MKLSTSILLAAIASVNAGIDQEYVSLQQCIVTSSDCN
jgi:hypothetical protein